MTDHPATPRPALLPADHRERVLTLLREVGIAAEADNCYVAWNGVVRVKVARMTGSRWAEIRSALTRCMYAHDWKYGIDHSELFIERSDELLFRPYPEAMR